MPIVCINRPNRSHERPFTESDASRIICYAIDNGATIRGIIEGANRRGCIDLPAEECQELKNEIKRWLEAAIAILLAILLGLTAAGRIARVALVFARRILPARIVRALRLERIGTIIEGEFRRVDDLAEQARLFLTRL